MSTQASRLSGHRPPSRGGIGGAIQPLDRDKRQFRQDAAAGTARRRSDRLSLRLAVGDAVVYASHGIGRVESAHAAEGTQPATIILALESGLKVTLPLVRAKETLRSLSGEPELEGVRLTLAADVAPSVEHSSRRRRFAQEKLTSGEIGGLAEIVRDGLQRERRLTTGSSKPMANELFRQARRLLTAEIAACRGIEQDEADAWILRQVASDV